MSFPENDDKYTEEVIEKVEPTEGSYFIVCDGWSLWCGENCPVVPKVGQIARKYGNGLGSIVRGLFINGQKVWYRTEAEQAEHSEIEMYGADATDWLARWDAGRSVWSIEMGGIGPGYEQAIQVTATEVLRHMIDAHYDTVRWDDREAWQKDVANIEKYGFANERISSLGLSGAQWGAAVSLASSLYRQGPRKVMTMPELKDRHIQVSKNFPAVAA